ncbi:hypothetical protein YC2023_119703 [Brassica napus]
MVVDSTAELKINAAKLLKTIVPYIDAKLASGNVLPALNTLGSDKNLNVNPSSSTDVIRRRERANAFCEAIRALHAIDLSQTSVREYLLPAIQNLFKDPDALDPAHKEALEIIMKGEIRWDTRSNQQSHGCSLGDCIICHKLVWRRLLWGRNKQRKTPRLHRYHLHFKDLNHQRRWLLRLKTTDSDVS